MKNNKRPRQQKALYKLFKIIEEHEERFNLLEGKISSYRSAVMKLIFACIAMIAILLSKTIIG